MLAGPALLCSMPRLSSADAWAAWPAYRPLGVALLQVRLAVARLIPSWAPMNALVSSPWRLTISLLLLSPSLLMLFASRWASLQSAASGFHTSLDVLQRLQQLPTQCQLRTHAVPAFQVDMLELYNEELRDLLAPALDRRRKQSLQIQVGCSPNRAAWPMCPTWAAVSRHVT